MHRRRHLLTLVALTWALPTSAHAAESFVGVTESAALVRFTSEDPFALSTPRVPRTGVDGERFVALAQGPDSLLGVGSSGRLYAIDEDFVRGRPIGPDFPMGLRGVRFSLAVAPGGATGRLLSDVGQDVLIDLRTGITQPGPGLRRADDGRPVTSAADYTAEGRMLGVGLPGPTVVLETAVGSSQFLGRPLITPRDESDGKRVGEGFEEPLGVRIGEGGRSYLLAVDSDFNRVRQSVLVQFDREGSEIPAMSASIKYFGRRMTTFAATGAAPKDRRAPQVSVRAPRRLSVRSFVARRFPIVVKSSEATSSVGTFVTLKIPQVRQLVDAARRDTPGVLTFGRPYFSPNRTNLRALRRAVGKRAVLTIRVADGRGNQRVLVRRLPIVP